MKSPHQPDKAEHYAKALRETTLRYERVVRALSMLRHMDALEDPSNDPGSIALNLLEIIADGLAAENCSVMMLTEQRDALELRAACSSITGESVTYASGEWSGRHWRMGEGVAGRVAETGEPIRLSEASEHEDFVGLTENRVQVQSLLAFPLMVDAQVVGVLNLSHSEPDFFSVEGEQILAMVAEKAGRILKYHQLRQRTRNAEAKLWVMSQHASDAILAFDADLTLSCTNPAARRFSGAEAHEVEQHLSLWRKRIAPGDRQRFEDHLQEVLETGAAKSLQYRFRLPSGEYGYFEQQSSPALDANGRVSTIVCVVRDVTDRRRAEEQKQLYRDRLEELVAQRSEALQNANRKLEREVAERREAEEAHRTVVEHSLQGLVVFQDGRVVYANPATSQMTGYSLEELLHFSIDELARIARPASGEGLDVRLRNYLNGKPTDIAPMEYEIISKNGRLLWHLAYARQMEYRGKPALLISHIDVTERRRAEQALKENQWRLQLAVTVGKLGVWELDLHTRAVSVDPSLRQLLGYGGEGFPETSKDYMSLVHPSDIELLRTAFRRCLKGDARELEVEHRAVHADGDYRWFVTRGEIVMEDASAQLRMLGTCLDITERKHAEAGRELLATVVEQAGEMIVVTDTAGVIEYVNPAFTRLTGYTRDEVVGQTPRILKSGSHGGAFYQELWNTISRGEVWSGRMKNKRKDGCIYEQEGAISPVRDSSGQTISYASVMHDVTAENELEAQLRQAQKMEAVGQLAGGVAHDFNNLLQGILGYSHLAMSGLPQEEKRRRHLEEVVRAAERAAGLARQLLTFSRQQSIEPGRVLLNGVIEEMSNMLQRLIGPHIELKLDLDAKLPAIMADASQLTQVLVNLCVNSRDAIDKGGSILISTSRFEADGDFAAANPGAAVGNYVQCTVADTGHGMAPEVADRIFEPFFTTKEIGKGTGLGLSTVYGIVKRHDGAIRVESAPGEGAKFHVYLPAVERPAPPEAKALSLKDAPGGTETILVAEDEDVVRRVVVYLLENAGYQVIVAHDGQEALTLYEQRREQIDLALLDIAMPRKSGRDVCEFIREHDERLPILFSSGHTSGIVDEAFLQRMSTELIRKPYQPNELLTRVRQLLD